MVRFRVLIAELGPKLARASLGGCQNAPNGLMQKVASKVRAAHQHDLDHGFIMPSRRPQLIVWVLVDQGP